MHEHTTIIRKQPESYNNHTRHIQNKYTNQRITHTHAYALIHNTYTNHTQQHTNSYHTHKIIQNTFTVTQTQTNSYTPYTNPYTNHTTTYNIIQTNHTITSEII